MKTHSTSPVSAFQAQRKDSSPAKLSARFAILWVALLVVPFATAQGNRPAVSYRADRILLKPKHGADLTELHRGLGTTVHRSHPGLGRLQTVRLRPGAALAKMLERFRQSGLVEYAEPDYLVRALNAPNDQFFAMPDNDPGTVDQWGLHNAGQDGGTVQADIDAPQAWDIRTSAGSVIVAVIDTGVRYTHEDLAPNMWTNPTEIPGNGMDDDGNGYVDDVHGIDARACTGDPFDNHGHGTHVAGIIGARGNNGVGIAGVAWQVRIMACGFLDVNAEGYISDAIESIDYARKKGAKIINASWGDYFTGPFNEILPDLHNNAANSRALHDAIANARNAGIIFVTACGNDGTDNDQHPLYPASYSVDNQLGEEYLPALDNIIGVAATDRDDERATFPQGGGSNFGASSVHLAAPGTDIISCYKGADDKYTVLNGTSMAAPHVAGACALVWAQFPTETYQQIIQRVLASTDSLPSLAGKCRTGGRLNLHKTLTNRSVGPLAKVTAKTSRVVLLPETTGTGDWVTVLTNAIKTPNMKDLVVTAALEVGLYTRTETPPDSLARASVQVRVLRDGQVIEPGIIGYNRRTQTLNSGEPIELILDTLEASSFSFVDVDVSDGVHTITVQARVDTGGSGDFVAFGLMGKGTLTVEGVQMIKGEDVARLPRPRGKGWKFAFPTRPIGS